MIVRNMLDLAEARKKMIQAPEEHILLIIRDMSTDSVEVIQIDRPSKRLAGAIVLDGYLQRVNQGIPLMVDTVKEYHANY